MEIYKPRQEIDTYMPNKDYSVEPYVVKAFYNKF